MVPASRLDAHADALDGYQAVVLDDVAISDASPRFWNALVAAVQNRGLGLMVLGGERSFARGGYRESALESVLPVSSEPAVLDQPASIVFVVDKSGSMGQGSGGVDRFQLAQRAVLETARGLTERDSLGLVVFDVAPRVLIPLGPAPAGTLALARDWQASPNGGTKLAPALEAAIDELERSGAGRRMLVVVTDGFIDDAPLAELRARLDRSRIETIALAVGPDADVSALERLVGAEAGVVLRVNEAAELPLVMRSALERRRARVERGTIAVDAASALPFSPGTLKDWPAIAAYAVTRSQPDASVAVQSRTRRSADRIPKVRPGPRGCRDQRTGTLDPAMVAVAGVAAARRWSDGLDQRHTPGRSVALAVSDLPAGLQIEADVQAADGVARYRRRVHRGEDADRRRTGWWPRIMSPPAGCGRRCPTPVPASTRSWYLLRSVRSDNCTSGAIVRRTRLGARTRHWTHGGPTDLSAIGIRISLRNIATADRARHPVDRSLIGLALALFLSGVLVDRTRLYEASVGRRKTWRRFLTPNRRWLR